MPTLPKRFISTEAKVAKLSSTYCKSCRISRRTDLKLVNTPGDELGADIWRSQDIFGLSVNINLCNDHETFKDSELDDVNITPVDIEDVPFYSDQQLEGVNLDSIQCQKSENIIIQMIINEIESLVGTYPFKKGTPEEIFYNYKIQVKYIPFLLNVFHFEIKVLSDESGEWEVVSREVSKKYIRALAAKIRARILDENKVWKLSA